MPEILEIHIRTYRERRSTFRKALDKKMLVFIFLCLLGRPVICIRYKADLCQVGKYSIKHQEINRGDTYILFDS